MNFTALVLVHLVYLLGHLILISQLSRVVRVRVTVAEELLLQILSLMLDSDP